MTHVNIYVILHAITYMCPGLYVTTYNFGKMFAKSLMVDLMMFCRYFHDI